MAGRKSAHPPEPGGWTLEVYERADGSCPYSIFLKNLDPYSQLVVDICVKEVLTRQGHEVCGTSWGTPLGGGLYEFRIRKSLTSLRKEVQVAAPKEIDEGREILLRVFFAVEGAHIVLLLSGYDKGKNSKSRRQEREIVKARKLLNEYRRS